MGSYPRDCDTPPPSQFERVGDSDRDVQLFANRNWKVPGTFLILIGESVDQAFASYTDEFPWFPGAQRTHSIYLDKTLSQPNVTCPLRGELRLSIGNTDLPPLKWRRMVFHEAFHLLHQAGNHLHDDADFAWYLEGSATWAAARHTKAVDLMELEALFKSGAGLDQSGQRRRNVGYAALPYFAFLEHLFWGRHSGPSLLSDLIHPKRLQAFNNRVVDSLDDLVKVHFQQSLNWLYSSFAGELYAGTWHLKPDGSSLLERWLDASSPDQKKKITIPEVQVDKEYDLILDESSVNYETGTMRLASGALRFIRIQRGYAGGGPIDVNVWASGNSWVALIEPGLPPQVRNAEFGLQLSTSAKSFTVAFAGPHRLRDSDTECGLSIDRKHRPTPPNIQQIWRLVHNIVGDPATRDSQEFVSRDDLGIDQAYPLHLDIGGEGHFTAYGITAGFENALNANVREDNSQTGERIPWLVHLTDWSAPCPFKDGTFNYITMQSAPLTEHNVREIARLIAPGGRVGLWIVPHLQAEDDKSETNLDRARQLAVLLNSTVQFSCAGPDEPPQGYKCSDTCRDEFAGQYPLAKMCIANRRESR